MSGSTLVFTIAGYLAIAIFLVGFMARVWKYATTPSPSKITLTHVPVGATGDVRRIAQGIKHTRVLFTATTFETCAGFLFLLQLHARFTLRLAADRTHYNSVMANHVHIMLFRGSTATGILTKYLVSADITAVKKFVVGLIGFSPRAYPGILSSR